MSPDLAGWDGRGVRSAGGLLTPVEGGRSKLHLAASNYDVWRLASASERVAGA
jgi:hypothetical protein